MFISGTAFLKENMVIKTNIPTIAETTCLSQEEKLSLLQYKLRT